jgi:hypothetical protein
MSSWSYYNKIVDFDVLRGKTIEELSGLTKDSEEVTIKTTDGNVYTLLHIQDCCEGVSLYDYESDCTNYNGAVILSAEETISSDFPSPHKYSDSHTWTFYKLETSKGGLWMRWLGESNGYYSESVDLVWVNKPEEEW